MGMAKDYIEAHEAMCKVVEESFRKMAKHCEFCKTGSNRHMNGRECVYKNGSTNSGVCAREICPVLEEKVVETSDRVVRFFKDESDAGSVLFELENLRIPDVVTECACVRDHGQEECANFGGVCRAGVYIDVPRAYGDIFDRLIKDLKDIGEIGEDLEE